MATLGGGAFFGSVGSFEEEYEFDAVVLDDTSLVHPQELTVLQRLERAVYLGLDTHGIRAKYAASAAYLGKKKGVMCEMFAATNWSATYND